MEGWKWARAEPGLNYWISKQHWLWRQGRLAPERAAMLRQAGLSFGHQTLSEWRRTAHVMAFWLTGSYIVQVPARLLPLTCWPSRSPAPYIVHVPPV